MSSGPVYNGGAFFSANGAATEVRRRILWCRGGGAGDGTCIGGRGRTRVPRLELMPTPGRVSVVPEPTRDNDALGCSAPRQEAVPVADTEPAAMSDMTTVEAKAFVPARDFALSK
jgi:hypothetical protein